MQVKALWHKEEAKCEHDRHLKLTGTRCKTVGWSDETWTLRPLD